MVTVTELNRAPDGRFEALEATGEFSPPVVSTEADLPDPANAPEGAEVTVLSDPNGNTSVYKVVDN